MQKQNGIVLVDKLSNQISDLQERINIVKKNNKKKAKIRKLKIFTNFFKLALPFLVALGIGFWFWTSGVGDIPFVPQEVLKVHYYKEEFDNYDGFKEENRYQEEINELDGTADYASKWEQKADGRYYRTTKKYRFKCKNVNLAALKEAINNHKDLDGLLGKPESSKLEVKGELTEEDIAKDGYIKVLYEYQDTNDFIMQAQDTDRNLVAGFGFIFLEGLNLFVMFLIMLHSDMLEYYICTRPDQINKEYKPHDTTEMERSLKEKQKIYQRAILKDDFCNDK